jgi:hypothetical protein
MKVSVLGVDLGKNVCSVAGLDALGAVVLRRRAKRETLIALAAKLPPCAHNSRSGYAVDRSEAAVCDLSPKQDPTPHIALSVDLM